MIYLMEPIFHQNHHNGVSAATLHPESALGDRAVGLLASNSAFTSAFPPNGSGLSERTHYIQLQGQLFTDSLLSTVCTATTFLNGEIINALSENVIFCRFLLLMTNAHEKTFGMGLIFF